MVLLIGYNNSQFISHVDRKFFVMIALSQAHFDNSNVGPNRSSQNLILSPAGQNSVKEGGSNA